MQNAFAILQCKHQCSFSKTHTAPYCRRNNATAKDTQDTVLPSVVMYLSIDLVREGEEKRPVFVFFYYKGGGAAAKM